MSYNPTYIMYFDGLELEPTPQVSVTKTPIYTSAEENIIGLRYEVTLDGHAVATLQSAGENISNTPMALRSLDLIKRILHRNGKNLQIVEAKTGNTFLLATGSKLTSFQVQEGNWYNYIKWTATIEFSDLSFGGSDPSGMGFVGVQEDSTSMLDPTMKSLLFGLNSYDDNWSFTVPEEEAYMYYTRVAYVDDGGDPIYLAEDYSQIQVSYTISATGRNFYDAAGTTFSAWERAKIFVQYKLWWQIYFFRIGKLMGQYAFINTTYNSNDYGNSMPEALTSANFMSLPVIPPILDQSICDRYAIFNETIDCTTSESDGTFSATYNCVLKRSDPYIGQPANSIHTFTVAYNQERSYDSLNRTITVNGSLNGLLRTNIIDNINDGQSFILPVNGTFYNTSSDTVSKFGNAYEDFITWIANPTLDDLSPNFKKTLGINYSNLFPRTDPTNVPCIQSQGYTYLYQILAEPKTFTINHNYRAGSVDYSATYDTDRSCARERGFGSMTITQEDAVPRYAEHVVVGRQAGPIIQNLNTNQMKKITISFDGVTQKTCASGNPFSEGYQNVDPRFQGLSAEVCDVNAYAYIPFTVKKIYQATEEGAIAQGGGLIATDSSFTYNPADGSFSTSRSYVSIPPANLPNTEQC